MNLPRPCQFFLPLINTEFSTTHHVSLQDSYANRLFSIITGLLLFVATWTPWRYVSLNIRELATVNSHQFLQSDARRAQLSFFFSYSIYRKQTSPTILPKSVSMWLKAPIRGVGDFTFFCRCWAQVLSSISGLWLDNTCPREESKDKLTWESVRRVHEQHLHSRAGPIHCYKKGKKTRLHHVCSWVFPVTSWQAEMEGKDGCLLGL